MWLIGKKLFAMLNAEQLTSLGRPMPASMKSVKPGPFPVLHRRLGMYRFTTMRGAGTSSDSSPLDVIVDPAAPLPLHSGVKRW